MKNILILSLTLFTLLSCSSDDETVDTTTILGTWKLISHSDLTTLPDCMINSAINFKSNNTLSGIVYEPNGNNCDQNNVTGSYSKETETLYKITIPNANSDTEITAELNTNKLIWTERNSLKTRILEFIK